MKTENNIHYSGSLDLDNNVFEAALVGDKKISITYREATPFLNQLFLLLGRIFSCFRKYAWIQIPVHHGKQGKKIFITVADYVEFKIFENCKKIDTRYNEGKFLHTTATTKDEQKFPSINVIEVL